MNHRQTEQVQSWIDKVSIGLSPKQLSVIFEQGLAAIFNRANVNISRFALVSILDRAHYESVIRYPFLNTLKITDNGFDFIEFNKALLDLTEDQLIKAFRCLIVELIWILGRLTNNIITPALYTALSAIVYEPPAKQLKRKIGKKHEEN